MLSAGNSGAGSEAVVRPLVVGLLFPCCPSAIRGFVISEWIYPIKGSVRKPLAKQRDRKIELCCFQHRTIIFDGNEDVSKILRYPIAATELAKYSEIISTEMVVEMDHERHATDAYAKAFGLKIPLPDYRPKFHLTEAEKSEAGKFVFKSRPNVVIQQLASIKNRDYPLSQWLEVIVKLEQRGWGVLLLGQKGELPQFPPQFQTPFIRDLSREGLSFRQSAAVLSHAQAFVGVDSVFVHMAHALDIPAVGLYGPFPWQIRTSLAPKTIAVSGHGPCAPCFWHKHGSKDFPPNKPCTANRLIEARQQCVVLAGITPERIVSKVSLLKP